MASGKPAVREGLEVNETRDGLIVYDPQRVRLHYLNASATVVFTLCDGTRDARRITEAVGKAYGVDPPGPEVGACLEQLRGEGLLR